MDTSKHISGYKHVALEAGTALSAILLDLEKFVGKPERDSLNPTADKAVEISHAFNALGKQAFKVYFIVLSKTLRHISKSCDIDHYDDLFVSILSLQSLVTESARINKEPLGEILECIELLSKTTSLNVGPELFLPQRFPQQFKKIDNKFKLAKEISDLAPLRKVLKFFKTELAKADSVIDEKHWENLFQVISYYKGRSTEVASNNYLWAAQILVAQIAKGRIIPTLIHNACIYTAIEVINENSHTVSPKLIKNITASILWNGIDTPELSSFAKTFGLYQVIQARVHELNIKITAPIMCTINSPLRDQVKVNIQRIEYWGSRVSENTIAADRIRELLSQLIQVCSFAGVPVDMLPVSKPDFDPDNIASVVEDIIYWFELVFNGAEASFDKNENSQLYNSKLGLAKIIQSSIYHVQNSLYKGKVRELPRLASTIYKASKALSFIDPVAAPSLQSVAILLSESSHDHVTANHQDAYRSLDSISEYIHEKFSFNNKKASLPYLNISNQSKTFSTQIYDDGVSFRSYLKSVLHRFASPQEESIYQAGNALRVLLDASATGFHDEIKSLMAQCDDQLLNLEVDPGALPEIPEGLIDLFNRHIDGSLEFNNIESHRIAIEPKVNPRPSDDKSIMKIHPFVELPMMDGIEADLFEIFKMEKNLRFNNCNKAITSNSLGNLKLEIHTLCGIHRELGYPEISGEFKRIELDMQDKTIIDAALIDQINSTFQMPASKEALGGEVELTTSDTSSHILDEQAVICSTDNGIDTTEIDLSSFTFSEDLDHELTVLFVDEATRIRKQLQKHLSQKVLNQDFILRSLHTLKGSSGLIECPELTELLHKGEEVVTLSFQDKSLISQSILRSCDALEYLCAELEQPQIVISNSVMAAAVASGALDIPLLDDLTLRHNGLLLSEALNLNDDDIEQHENSVSISSAVLNELLNKLSQIESTVYGTVNGITKIVDRSTEQVNISDRQLKQSTKLSHSVNEHDSSDFIATDYELSLRAIQDDAKQSKMLSLSNKSNLTDTQNALETLTDISRKAHQSLSTSMDIPISEISKRLERIVHNLNRSLDTSASLIISGSDLKVSKSLLADLQMILEHMIRNSFAHGFKTADHDNSIWINFSMESSGLVVTFRDDGDGIDKQLLINKAITQGLINASGDIENPFDLLFHAGFSTKSVADKLSGRGVGLDVVSDLINRRNGSIDVKSNIGEGTRFDLTVPDTIGSIRAIIVGTGYHKLAIPLAGVETLGVEDVESKQSVKANGKVYRLVNLSDLTEDNGTASSSIIYLKKQFNGVNIAIKVSSKPKVKTISPVTSPIKIKGVLGYSCLIDSTVASVIDPTYILMSRIELVGEGYRVIEQTKKSSTKRRILVVDDSAVARTKLERIYSKYGFEVDFAENGLEGLKQAESNTYDLISTDVEMPVSSGFDFVKALKSNSKISPPPIIMVTSRSSERHQALANHIGVDVFVLKSSANDGIETAIDALRQAGRLA